MFLDLHTSVCVVCVCPCAPTFTSSSSLRMEVLGVCSRDVVALTGAGERSIGVVAV